MQHVRTGQGWRRVHSPSSRAVAVSSAIPPNAAWCTLLFLFSAPYWHIQILLYSPWRPQSLQPSLVSTVNVLQLVVCGFVLSCPGWPVAAGFFSSLWTPWLMKLSMVGGLSLGTAFQKLDTQTSWLWHRNSINYWQRSLSTWPAACSPYQMAQLGLKNVCNVKIPSKEKPAVSYVEPSLPNFSLCSCCFHEQEGAKGKRL